MKDRLPLTRREVLQKALAIGVITVASPFGGKALLFALEEKEVRPATPPNELGPFYKKRSPLTSMMRITGEPGMPLSVAGGAYNTRGEKLTNATVEVWQTDHFGHYDIEGYRYRAKLQPDASAKYAFDSVMPGHYPSRVCQHIHYLVTAPGHRPLITQLYFATDPVFEGDPDKNFQRDPLIQSRELVRPVMLMGDPKDIHAAVNFDVVLERL